MEQGITLAGNIVIDHNREVDRYPNHSTLVKVNKIYNTIGGAVSNSGISLARINPKLPIKLLGLIGNDADGEFILDEFSKYPNIDTENISYSDLPTSFTDVISDVTNNTRTFFNYSGADSKIGPEHFNFSKLKTDILHIGYVLLLEVLDSEDEEFGTKMARVLNEAQQNGIKTSIDVVTEDSDRFSKIVPSAIKYTNFCIINEEEAGRTVNINPRKSNGNLDLENCKIICEKLFEIGVKDWVVIHAREGGIGMDSAGNFVLKAALAIAPEQIKGTTGAGDAFLAGVLYGAYSQYDLEKAVKLGIASSNASILEEGPTAGVKSETELWNFYNNMPKEDWEGFY